MCGITGIIDMSGERPIDRNLLRAMNDTQVHRGPDDEGFHVEPGVGLGHRRLSIIDLSTGKQPLCNEDDSVVIVFNGEIYNFQGLRQELEALGHRFRTRTDTEVIVHGWEEWGRDCVKRFRGMFAFAIWDRNRGELFLARDRLGKKPLYYAVLPAGEIVFASELKALLRYPGVSRAIDPCAIEEYFALGYVADPRCILRSVRKLPPASTLVAARGRPVPEPQSYWDVSFSPVRAQDEETAIQLLLERFEEAVRIRMIADVPVGAFLSGGVDSSGVVAMMARSSAQPVNTCSISFGETAFDESRHARRVAEVLATRHFVESVDPNDIGLVDRLAGIYDEPFADSSALPTFRVCELARKHVKVALSGDGGDEVLGGYRRYLWHMNEETFRRLLPLGLRRPLFGTLARLYPRADWAPRMFRAKATLGAMSRSGLDAYFDSVSIASEKVRSMLFSREHKANLQGYKAIDVFRAVERNLDGLDALSKVQYIDIKTNLVGDILTKVDRASMANSLEVRAPLLDHEFVEWAAGLPRDLKLRGSEGKYVFKKAVARHVPAEVIYRPKMGFAVPLGRWFRHELRQTLRDRLTRGSLGDSGVFDMVAVDTLVTEHQAGLRDHSAMLWSLLLYESFQRQVLGATGR
ncbi:MAG: amidotransferase 1, exosortase A system-associated [Gammaproteobacteria bacterium]|nr:amidotransferase 1, exosortase A system-associated [Gammaproteobacteria bacterium]